MKKDIILTALFTGFSILLFKALLVLILIFG